MMDFKEFIYSEGKSIAVTIDMENFANQTVRRFNQLDKPKHRELIYARDVDFGKYGTKFVRVLVNNRITNLLQADPLKDIVYIGKIEKSNFASAVEHELVHLIDPKLTNKSLRRSNWGIETLNNKGLFRNDPLSSSEEEVEDYYRNPWEIDAWMSQLARSVIKEYIKKGYSNKEFVKYSLSKRKPMVPPEKVWFKNPKLWKKWLNTLYSALENSL